MRIGRDINSITNIKDTINRLIDFVERYAAGKTDNAGNVTLTENTTTTTVNNSKVGGDSVIVLCPLTANASAEMGNGTIYVSTRNKFSFVLTHANNAQTDRTFGYAVFN